jgi:ribosome assembly protein YihI (activator of Der GTPase)
MFSDEQLDLIDAAIEEYGVLADEETADKCDEILAIIEAYFINKNYRK